MIRMENINRTKKVLANAKISLIFFVILLFLNFVSRSVFINNLGTDVLGLNTLATNLIGFLNLAELGIVSAIATSLYKPIAEDNKKEIIEIITIQGWLYRNIAYLITGVALILMCFFPIIFKKIQLPLWYIYSIFCVLLISSLLTYFINYKQVLLIAEMKEYKIILCIKTIQIIKIILQIFFVVNFKNGFFYWLLLEFLYGIISSFFLKRIIDKEYPWLDINIKKGRWLKNKHKNIIKHTKQLFFHKIAGFVLLQTTPMIIYAYVNLKMVTIYDNYMMIILGIASLVTAVFSSFQPAIGNLVANGDKKIILSFFEEYFILRYWIASIFCVILFFQGHDFITLWVGESFILTGNAFFWLNIYLFLVLTRVIDPFVYAFGLYGDIYAPIAEAIINLGLSIVLGYYFGLSGIIAGVVISLMVIVFIWRPFYIYAFGFKAKFYHYIKKLIMYIFCIVVSIVLFKCFIGVFYLGDNNPLSFMLNTLLVIVSYSTISSLVLYVVCPEFRKVVSRVFVILKLNKFLTN